MKMAALKSAERQELLKSIQGQYEALLDTFPAGLRPDMIRSYSQDDFNSPGLLSLVALPFWVGHSLQLSDDICRDMAVGNLFLLHSFQSFDFVIDGDRPNTSTRSLIILGSLCHLQVMNHYRPHFPSDSPFWERLEAYWQEWGESILWEAKDGASQLPFSEEALFLTAHKSAALKMCPTGLALLAEKPDLIPAFEQAIDLMHAAMQLIDDLKDWREDLQHQRYNSFLGLLVADGLLAANRSHAPDEVAALMVSDGVMSRYAGIVQAYAARARDLIQSLGIEPWAQLVGSMAEQAAWITGKYERLSKLFSFEEANVKLKE